MLNALLLIIAIIIVAVLILAATKPNIFRVERSATINTAPDRIIALLEDFHQWGAWSPWEKLDPEMVRTFSGASSGKGAVYDWVGNKKVGKGRMEILDIEPRTLVRIKLDFLEPFEAHNTTEISLNYNGSATTINWAMFGPASFAIKVMHVFMNMDKMVGKDFETGLANLKALAESKS
jgi:hypothetical protein